MIIHITGGYKMKKGKRIFALLLSAIMISTLTITGCEKKAPVVKPIAKVNSKEAYIGLKNTQKWLFKKEGDTWKFDGVYATRNGKEEKVFYGTSGKLNEEDKLVMSGEYFNVQGAVKEEDIGNYLDGKVTDIKLEENDGKKSLLLTGKGFTSILTATKDDHYISREITITVPKNLAIYESEVSFTLRSNQSAFYEYGYVLTHANDEPQTSVPYAFPAITSKLTAQDDNKKQFNFTEVMDYYNTSECFKTARRNENLNGFVELGIISTDAQLMADTEYTLSERISVRDGSEESYYDMIGDARAEYSKNYDVPVEQIAVANGNMGVSDWIDAAYGAIGDVLDTRGRPKIHEKVIMKSEYEWENKKIGGSVPPIKTSEGWLFIYHGVADDREPFCYRAGAALLDLENPSKVIARLPYPILEPTEDYEVAGDVPNVVFPVGAYIHEGYVYISYGGADKVVALCRFKYDELMEEFRKNPIK